MSKEVPEGLLLVVGVASYLMNIVPRATLKRLAARNGPKEHHLWDLTATLFTRVKLVVFKIHVQVARRGLWQ